jgi:predicted transporter
LKRFGSLSGFIGNFIKEFDMQKYVSGLCDRLNDISGRAYAALTVKAAQCQASPFERRVMAISAAATFGVLALAGAAHAEGIAEMVEKAADQGESIKESLGKIFAALGFAGAGLGGYNWWRKGKEGDHSQIKGSQIFVPILAGAALGAIGFVMIKAGETVGISGSSQGALPN